MLPDGRKQADGSESLTAEELAARVQAGSTADYTALVRRFGPRLYGYFRNRISCLEDCEDLVQDTLVKAYFNLNRYDARRPFAAWLYAIGTRCAVDFFRARKWRSAARIGEEAAPQSDPRASAIVSEEGRNLWSLARTLPGKQYEALWLRYAEDLSVKEIAGALGITRVHAKVLLYRARVRLAECCGLAAAESQGPGRQEPRAWIAADPRAGIIGSARLKK